MLYVPCQTVTFYDRYILEDEIAGTGREKKVTKVKFNFYGFEAGSIQTSVPRSLASGNFLW